MNPLDLQNRPGFAGMLVGRSGHGKSAALASFAEEGPVEILDLDRRARGILGMRSVLGDDLIKRINIDQSITPANGYEALKKKFEMYAIKSQTNSLPFRTLAIEGVRTLGQILILESKRLRGVKGGGHKLGAFQFTDPSDYNYCSQTFLELMYNYIMPLQCNFILSSWIVDRWGKDPNNEYGSNIIVGQKLLTTDKWSEEVPGYFDEVYYFEKEDGSSGTQFRPKFTVQFETDLAKTCHEKLKGLGKVDITGKSFYKTYMEKLK